MSDISSLPEPYDDQELSDTSSQFALDVEDPNEAADEDRRQGQAAGRNDEPLADKEWLQKTTIESEERKGKGCKDLVDASMEPNR
eukprot:Seg3945.2 transcript_id=Seg3945.2/GoldUCD/mRNA.D3Y31 product="hypothetical protein" pseudo=true protein_id=Seg3945.2/GoldUCD/D3Y31